MHFYIKYAAEVKYNHMNLQTYACKEAVLLTDKQTDLEHESQDWHMDFQKDASTLLDMMVYCMSRTKKKTQNTLRWFGELGKEKDESVDSLRPQSPTCPPHYLGEYALRRTLMVGAAEVEWGVGGGGGGAGGCFDSPSTPQPHNRLLSQRGREGRTDRQEWESRERWMETDNTRREHGTRQERGGDRGNSKCAGREREKTKRN